MEEDDVNEVEGDGACKNFAKWVKPECLLVALVCEFLGIGFLL